MPTVPNLEAPGVGAEPLPGRPFPRLSDEVSPAAFGTPIARGLEDISSVMSSEQARQKVQNDNVRVIDANTQLEAGRNAMLYGQVGQDGTRQGGAFSLHGTDAINLPAKLLPEYQKLAENISSGLTPDQQRLFHGHVAAGSNELNLQLNRYEFEESNRLSNEVYSNGIDQAISSAALGWRDPIVNGKNRADIKALVTLQGDREGWPQAKRDTETQAQLARMHGAVIDSMLTDHSSQDAQQYFESVKGEIIAHNPKAAEEIQKNIEAGRVTDTANGVLEAFKGGVYQGSAALLAVGKSDLPPDQQARVIQLVDRGRSDYAQMARQDPGVRSVLTDLDGQIASGTVTPQAVGTVESLWRRGALTDDQRLVMRDQVLRATKKGLDDQQAVQYVRDALAQGTALDPKADRGAVNLYTSVATMGQAPGTPGYNDVAVSVTKGVGVVPDGAVHFMRANLVGGSDQDAAAAAQLAASLQRVNPRAYLEATDPETRALAKQVNDAVTAGTEPKTAVALARENAQRTPALQKFLDDAWNKEIPKATNRLQFEQNLIRDGLKGDPAYQESGFHFGNTAPVPPASMAAEFQLLSRDYFGRTRGNLSQAHAMALDDLKGTWGVSEVNGSRQLMKYAPEHMFPGLTADDIRADLAKEGRGAARLVESAETGASGGRKWGLEEPDKFGAWDVVRGDDHLPVRYELPKPSKPIAWGSPAEETQADDREALRQRKAALDSAAEHSLTAPEF